jgi:photosystem II stability/assembly factor-like uncharacterized protein
MYLWRSLGAMALVVGGVGAGAPARGAWLAQDSGTMNDLHSVNFHHSTAERAWACGDHGTIVYTSNGGQSWELQDTGTSAHLYGIVFHEDGGSVIAVGERGTILRSMDQGTTWTLIPSPTDETLRDTSDFRYYAVGDHGTILKSTDLGQSWSIIDSGSQANLRSVIGLEPTPVAVGEGGTILRGNPPGLVWQPMSNGTTATLNGVPLFTTRLLVGDDGTILRATTNGGPWFPVAIGRTESLRSIADANGAVYVVGAHGTILKSTDNGASWGFQQTPVTQDLNGAFFYLFAHIGYAVGNGGTILKTTDGGGPIVEPVDAGPEAAAAAAAGTLHAPNPFRGTARLTYALARDAHVSLTVFDVSGRLVGDVFQGRRARGTHVATWNPDRLPAGVYLCMLRTDDGEHVLRTTLVR